MTTPEHNQVKCQVAKLRLDLCDEVPIDQAVREGKNSWTR